jgi:hypothetical protein
MSDSRRARPKGDLQLHAHPVPEALELSNQLEDFSLSGPLSNSQEYSAMVSVPSPFTYLMMKVTAFGDQVNNVDKDQGRHHALDVYRIVAMLSEPQFLVTKQQFKDHASSEHVQHVKNLFKEFFALDQRIGILRIREHAFFGANMNTADFVENLRDILD